MSPSIFPSDSVSYQSKKAIEKDKQLLPLSSVTALVTKHQMQVNVSSRYLLEITDVLLEAKTNSKSTKYYTYM